MKDEREQQKKPPQKRDPQPDSAFFRAPNEDDDGYDPYSDRPAREDFYEEDPWK